MSGKCGKCDVEFVTSDIVAKCTDCKVSYHPACTSTGQNFTKAKSKNWKCDACKEESSSSRSNVSYEGAGKDDKRSILEALASMKNDLIFNMDSKIGSVQGSISALAEDLKQMGNKICAMETSQEELKVRCDKLEQAKEALRGEVRELRQQLHDTEQHSRAANIEIQGIPRTDNEDIYHVLMKVARAISVPYKREDISVAHRLRLFSKKHAHPPIIAQFVSRSVREAWLAAARAKKNLNATEISASLQPSVVYVNEHLTGDNKALLGRARRLLREKKLHFAGFFNGKVLVKASENDRATRVWTMEDLDQFDM